MFINVSEKETEHVRCHAFHFFFSSQFFHNNGKGKCNRSQCLICLYAHAYFTLKKHNNVFFLIKFNGGRMSLKDMVNVEKVRV